MAAKKKAVSRKAPPAKRKSPVGKVATPKSIAPAKAPVVVEPKAPVKFLLRVSPEGIVMNRKVDYSPEGLPLRVRSK